MYSTGASSNYHSLQVSFSKRFSRGFQFEGSYTWAKAIQEGLSHPNSYNLKMSRALADYDIAHRFVAELHLRTSLRPRPEVRSRSGVRPLDLLLGQWQFNGFTTYQSGTPLTISATNVAGLFNSRGLANNNGKSGKLSGDVHDRLNRYFDTSVFSQPAALHSAIPAEFAGPARSRDRNWDLSIFKDFVLREGLRLQFRAETFNALNTVRFGSPDTSVPPTSSDRSARRQIRRGRFSSA